MMRQATTAKEVSMRAKQKRFSASARQRWLFRPPATHAGTDLPLSKTPKGTILASQGAGIRGMSGKMTRQPFSAGT